MGYDDKQCLSNESSLLLFVFRTVEHKYTKLIQDIYFPGKAIKQHISKTLINTIPLTVLVISIIIHNSVSKPLVHFGVDDVSDTGVKCPPGVKYP